MNRWSCYVTLTYVGRIIEYACVRVENEFSKHTSKKCFKTRMCLLINPFQTIRQNHSEIFQSPNRIHSFYWKIQFGDIVLLLILLLGFFSQKCTGHQRKSTIALGSGLSSLLLSSYFFASFIHNNETAS